MRVSAVVCTWNRARLLESALAGFARLEIPEGVDWELLVVNNACQDDTDAVLERHRAHLPLRRLHEERLGLSHARNRAVAELRGDLVLWTDDDAEPGRRWLAAYVAAARSAPRAAFFGGPVEARFEVPPPEWLLQGWEQVAGAYAVRDLGPVAVPLDRERVPYGANYAVRADVQRRYPYDPALGRRGHALVGGEELKVMRAMLADGLEGLWVPGARLKHRVTRDRMTLGYLRRFHTAVGLEWARVGARRPRSARELLARALRAELRYRLRRHTTPPATWLGDLVRASRRWGEWRGRRDRPSGAPLLA